MKKTIPMVLGLLLLGSPLYAASLGDLQVRELEAFHNSAYFVPLDSHLLNINYVGSSTEACINISVGTITVQSPFGTASTEFGSGSETGAYDFTADAYDTLGELCDAIDSLTYFVCNLTGGKRDDDPIYMGNVIAARGSYDAKDNAGYNIKIDSGTTTSMPTHTPFMIRLGITPQVGRRVILTGCINSSDGTDDTLVFGKLRQFEGSTDGVVRNDSTKVYHSAASGGGTPRIIPNALWPFGEWLEFGKDEHVVIQEADGTTPQTTSEYINCFWIER